MKTTKVKVCGNDNGDVIIQSKKNPLYGHVQVEQYVNEVDDNGFARVKKRTALIPGKIEDLKRFNFKYNSEIDGQIIFKESLVPFNPKNPDIDIKIAGATGIICTLEGQTIYRKNFYSQHPNAHDVSIKHDNDEEIRNAYQEIKEHMESDTNVGEDFSL